MQLLPDLRPVVLSAIHLVQQPFGTFVVAVLGGMIGAVLIARLTRKRRYESFKVSFHIDLWKVLIGMKLLTQEEVDAYTESTKWTNLGDPSRRIPYEGITLLCLASCEEKHPFFFYWSQYHEFRRDLKLFKRLEMVPKDDDLLGGYHHPRIFIAYVEGNFEIGISLGTKWWDKYKDDPEVAAFVTRVKTGGSVTDLVLGAVPGVMVHLYGQLGTRRWRRKFEMVEKSLKEVGWVMDYRDKLQARFSRELIKVTLDAF